MTISTQAARQQYTGNGSQTAFPVPFPFLEEDHLLVYRQDVLLVKDIEYAVSGAGFEVGGQVTLHEPLPAGQVLTILRDSPYTQELAFLENSPFPSELNERALDKLTMLLQQLHEMLQRAVVVPPWYLDASSRLIVTDVFPAQVLQSEGQGRWGFARVQPGAGGEGWVATEPPLEGVAQALNEGIEPAVGQVTLITAIRDSEGQIRYQLSLGKECPDDPG